MRARLRDRGGFTLVETVVALLIVSLALVPLLGAANQALRDEAKIAPAHEAVALAETRMEELALLPADSLVGYLRPRESTFAAPFAAYRWHALMRTEPESASLVRAAVIVRWAGGSYSLETVFYRPEMRAQVPPVAR